MQPRKNAFDVDLEPNPSISIKKVVLPWKAVSEYNLPLGSPRLILNIQKDLGTCIQYPSSEFEKYRYLELAIRTQFI
jgi:hypothetical protein